MMMAYAIDKEGEISADTDLIIKQICNFWMNVKIYKTSIWWHFI
jgi:hypothetical protein